MNQQVIRRSQAGTQAVRPRRLGSKYSAFLGDTVQRIPRGRALPAHHTRKLHEALSASSILGDPPRGYNYYPEESQDRKD